ncbi:RNA polymerase sigma factor [Peristeroidobacter agariperforans]|uniref:RNA polymerase sigma factor n=1 Tax=Peristeroidobacter agariperforans TaxID=268404 RepID=UPI001300AADC|nr:RNA polymerase sigma factor [Peristeroidobacter agariperforans]
MSSSDLRVRSQTAVDAFKGRLLRYVRRRGASREDAEDVIQEAYLRLLRYSAEHEVQSEERLLLIAAKNLALDSIRRRRARDKTAVEYAVIAAAAQNWPAPDEELYSQQCLHNLQDALAMLPERCREIFLLHRIDNLTYGEIALRCGISASAVEKHIARACLLIDARINPEVECPPVSNKTRGNRRLPDRRSA